ncbi:MAG: 2-phosphosulfolactate phosphatase [Bacteroidales bacterium]|nr:2-phosphosulfolactate phosphatase [Bacteroidales bacterium]
MPGVEVCLSPAIFEYHKKNDSVVVVVDVLRATTSICEAFRNGIKSIIPVATESLASDYKNKGFIVAAERNGIPLEFADFGNSPFNFSQNNVKGKVVVFTTTNGTKTIQLASSCLHVLIGSFINYSALCNLLLALDKDVIILCAGWKNRINIEDSVFAGAVVDFLLQSNKFSTICDSAIITQEMWSNNKEHLEKYIHKSAQNQRLKKNNIDDSIPYCLSLNKTDLIPVYKNGEIVLFD